MPQHARFRILDSSSIRSEDPDLEKLTIIYLQICVCFQFSRPINQQDNELCLRWDTRCSYLCDWWVWGQAFAFLVPQGS